MAKPAHNNLAAERRNAVFALAQGMPGLSGRALPIQRTAHVNQRKGTFGAGLLAGRGKNAEFVIGIIPV